jgi:uncharacterized membrane protein
MPASPNTRLIGAVAIALQWALAERLLTRFQTVEQRRSRRATVVRLYAILLVVVLPFFTEIVFPLIDHSNRYPFIPLLLTYVGVFVHQHSTVLTFFPSFCSSMLCAAGIGSVLIAMTFGQ